MTRIGLQAEKKSRIAILISKILFLNLRQDMPKVRQWSQSGSNSRSRSWSGIFRIAIRQKPTTGSIQSPTLVMTWQKSYCFVRDKCSVSFVFETLPLPWRFVQIFVHCFEWFWTERSWTVSNSFDTERWRKWKNHCN